MVSRIGSTVWMQNGSMIVRAEDTHNWPFCAGQLRSTHHWTPMHTRRSGRMGRRIQRGGQQRPKFGQPCVKLCLQGLRSRRAGLVRELFLAFLLCRIRPGGLPFCPVMIAQYLRYRLGIHALPRMRGALTALPLTLQLRSQ